MDIHAMLAWTEQIAALTRMQSGFFGIMFPELLPIMREMAAKEPV
jgi:hypothetical protein